jgi:hypothetical protein
MATSTLPTAVLVPHATLKSPQGTWHQPPLVPPMQPMAAAPPPHTAKGGPPAAWRIASAKQRTMVSRHICSRSTSPQATATGVRRRRRRAGARGENAPLPTPRFEPGSRESQARARAGAKLGAVQDVAYPNCKIYDPHF